MKHQEAINLLTGLTEVKGIESFKVNYAVQKNIAVLKKEVEILQKQEQEILDIKKEFEAKRIELCETYSKVDGAVQTNPDKTFKIVKEKQSEFESKFIELKEEYKKTLDDFETKHKEFLKFLSETESEVKLHYIQFTDVPENISTENTAAIFLLIKEE